MAASSATTPARSAIKVRSEGFTVLHDCAETEADIILIHGLQGHPKKTWLYKEFSIIPKFSKQAQDEKRRFFSGAANTTNILGLARAFLDELEEKRRKAIGRPLVLIAHSLGGLLLKAVLRQSFESEGSTSYDHALRDICDSTIGTIFLGTPHRGSDLASIGEVVANVARIAQFDASQNILKDLRVDATILEILDESFSKLYLKHNFMFFTFEEGRGLGIPLIAMGKVVPSWSAHLGFTGEQRGTINANHRKMCRFPGHDCPGYGHVRRAVVRCLAHRSGNTDIALDSEFLQALSSLENPETSLRFQQVSQAHDGTYEWIFINENLGFVSWLQSDSPLYWIKGKPASGKSTLMKFAVNDARVGSAFDGRPGKVSTAAFFFHDRGSHLQKSLDGLLQEILSTIITDIPELKPLFHKVYTRHRRPGQQNRDFKWDSQITSQVLIEILQQDLVDVSLLFFLDALDEYDGKHSDIARLLLKLKGTKKTLLKICFSSRPEQVFLDTFPDLKGFSIHEHTRGDIEAVIDAEFGTNIRMGRTLETDDAQAIAEVDLLKREIGDLCQGVFLWVRLVLEEILNEYTNGANLQELRTILQNVPKDLDDYYEHLVERIDRLHPDYRSERDLMFEILRSAQKPLSLVEFLLALQLAPVTDLEQATIDLPELDAAKRRINTRCGALIEIQSGHEHNLNSTSEINGFSDLAYHRVQFLHQTVKTWRLKKPILSRSWGQPENGYTYLLKMYTFTDTPMDRAPPQIEDFMNLLSCVSQAEMSTESSVHWILKQHRYFRIPERDSYFYHHTIIPAMAGAAVSLKESLKSGTDLQIRDCFGAYINALYLMPGVSYSREVAEILFSGLPQPREVVIWQAIGEFIQTAAKNAAKNDAVNPHLVVVNLCQLAVEYGIDTGSLFPITSDLVPLHPWDDEKSSPTTSILHLAFRVTYGDGHLSESFMAARLETARILLGAATNINVLETPTSRTPLDLALGSFNAALSHPDWETSIVDKRGYLEGIEKLCKLLIDQGGKITEDISYYTRIPAAPLGDIRTMSLDGFEMDLALHNPPRLLVPSAHRPRRWNGLGSLKSLFSS